jgi:hypothetical protein
VIVFPFGPPIAPDRMLETLANAGALVASDATAGDLARALLRPALLILLLREVAQAFSKNLLLLAQAQRFDERPAAVRELLALDELLRLARARRHIGP